MDRCFSYTRIIKFSKEVCNVKGCEGKIFWKILKTRILGASEKNGISDVINGFEILLIEERGDID